MDIHQLKTFIAVAREGSITRASERVHLSQPAVSAHIKALEDALDVVLFERTARGMTLTSDGQRLLAKAEQALAAHQALVDEAARIKGGLHGTLRLGASASSDHAAVGRLLTTLAERCPDVDVTIVHGSSQAILAGLRAGSLDAGFYNEGAEPEADLHTLEVASFGVHVASSPGLFGSGARTPAKLDWSALVEVPWVYPTASSCCGHTAERLFAQHRARPKRIISIDRESMTRTLIASGIGVGLLHEATAKEAEARGEVDLLVASETRVRVMFAHLASRSDDPLLEAADAIMRGGSRAR